jgi:ornithine cyclodeaminase/alanine dehydrogenase-like protein (mu-crystallin family)
MGPEELRRALTMRAAIEALDEVFGGEPPAAPPRSHHNVGEGDLLVMPAWSDDFGVGIKLVTVAPGNPDAGLPLIHGIYALFDPGSLNPAVLLDGGALTAIRTAAVSGVATKYLARLDATAIGILGGGTQGLAHLEAMTTVLPRLEVARCASRSQQSTERLVERAHELGLRAEAASPAEVAQADVICTCTTSSSPLFDGSLIRPGTHVNAVGSYKAEARELDDVAIARARVFVEVREPALREAGDLRIPIESNVLVEEEIIELADVAGGRAMGRRDAGDITIFKSVGVAFEDLVIAATAYRAFVAAEA